MDKTAEKILVVGTDVALDRVEGVVMRWAQVGHTASFIGALSRGLGFVWRRSARPAAPRPWLRQKKGRGAHL